jgi:hypothetical protein
MLFHHLGRRLKSSAKQAGRFNNVVSRAGEKHAIWICSRQQRRGQGNTWRRVATGWFANHHVGWDFR